MRPTVIRVSTSFGSRKVESWPCGVAGLAVASTTGVVLTDCVTPSWVILHVRSGANLWRCIGSPEAALDNAQRIATFADWTMPAHDLRQIPDLMDRMIAAGRHQHGNKAPGADLNRFATLTP